MAGEYMENSATKERCEAGRRLAREAIAKTGKTHKGKHGLGRKPVTQAAEIAVWRETNSATINETAKRFNVSNATVKRYCAKAAGIRAKWIAIHAEVAKDDKRTEHVIRSLEVMRKRCNF